MSGRQHSRRLTFVVEAPEQGQRLDAMLGRRPELGSRSRVAELIRAGNVSVDGRPQAKSHLLVEGETVVVLLPEDEAIDLTPESLAVPVLYEDQWLLVADIEKFVGRSFPRETVPGLEPSVDPPPFRTAVPEAPRPERSIRIRRGLRRR